MGKLVADQFVQGRFRSRIHNGLHDRFMLEIDLLTTDIAFPSSEEVLPNIGHATS